MPEPWRPRRRPSRWLIPLLLLGGLVVFHELLDSSILDIGLFPRQDDGQVRGISVKLRKELRKLVVAVVEPTPWHTEVLASVLSSMDDMGVNATAFTFDPRAGLTSLVGHTARRAEDLPAFLDQVDVVILNTCDAKFWEQDNQVALFQSISDWATQSDPSTENDEKDKRVVCIPHEIDYYGYRHHDDSGLIASIAQRGRLRFVTLSAHTSSQLWRTIEKWSERTRNAFWERAASSITDFAPIFRNPAVGSTPKPARRMNKAAIVGRIRHESRQYNQMLHSLEQSIMHNPSEWGYELVQAQDTGGATQRLIPIGPSDPSNPNAAHVPSLTAKDSFTLHLIGYAEQEIGIPPILADKQWPIVVVNHTEGEVEYYAALSDMDIILPAFADDAYVESRASASIPAGLIANTPVLATSRLLSAYKYLSPPAYILSPISMDPIDALVTIRRGQDPWRDEFGELKPRGRDGTSWWPVKRKETWDEYLDSVRVENARVWARVLLD